jgi:hypothetical protein
MKDQTPKQQLLEARERITKVAEAALAARDTLRVGLAELEDERVVRGPHHLDATNNVPSTSPPPAKWAPSLSRRWRSPAPRCLIATPSPGRM